MNVEVYHTRCAVVGEHNNIFISVEKDDLPAVVMPSGDTQLHDKENIQPSKVHWRDSQSTSRNKSQQVTSKSLRPILPKKPCHRCKARTREVINLMRMFEEMQDRTDESVLTTLFLTGPPGSGKTQLAREFGEKILNMNSSRKSNPALVFTLNADSASSFLQSTQVVLEQLKRMEKSAKTDCDDEMAVARFYLQELREFLQNYPGEWLLIFDNVFNGQNVASILPEPGSKDWGQGKVLITSQDNDIVPAGHEYAKGYRLNSGMRKEDAMNLLKEVSGTDVDDYAVQVAELFNFFPLPLACVATYVADVRQDRPSINYSWEQFLTYYLDQKGQLHYRSFAKNVYPCSMAFATALAAKRMTSHNEILQLTFDFLSYCRINHPVPLDCISKYVQANLGQRCVDLEKLKGDISRCSLLIHGCTGSRSIETVSFHQVMGNVFQQMRIERHTELSESVMREKFVNMLKSMNMNLEPDLRKSTLPDSVALQILMSPHLESFIAYGTSHGWNICEEFVYISVNVAQCLYHVSGVSDVQRVQYLENAYEIAQELQLTGIRYCNLLANLGFYFRELHKLEKSQQVMKQALAMTEDKLSTEWLLLKSVILKDLSWTYKLLRQPELAVQSMEKSIDVAKKVPSAGHEEVMERLCKLAFFYCDQFKMEKAKQKVDEALQIAVEQKENRDLKKAATCCDSGKVFLNCAYREEEFVKKNELLSRSRKLHDEALKIYEHFYEDNDHLDVAGVLVTYSAVCKELGDYESATNLIKRAKKIYNGIKHHIGLSFALSYEADLLLAKGEDQEAAKLLSDSVGAKFLLASLFHKQKKFSKAKDMFENMLADCRSGKSPPSHRWVDQAKILMSECEGETSKRLFIFSLKHVLVLLIAVLVGLLLFVCKGN